MSVREGAWRFCRALAAAVFLAFAGHGRPAGPLVFGSSNRTNDVPTQRSRMTSKHAASRTTAATPGFTWLWAASITMVFTILSVIAPAVATGAVGGPSGTATTHRATATTANHLPPLGRAPSPAVGVAGAASIAPGALGIAATGFAAEDRSLAFRSDTSHIFRDAPGHLPDDTPANRALLQGAVRPQNLVGTNQWGISTYRETLPDGRQVWVEVRNGTTITNGGVNDAPRS
jgi:hypothetical protein